MNKPLVFAICLTKDRPEMTRRAIKSFREQTYENRVLLVYDSSEMADYRLCRQGKPEEWYAPTLRDGRSIGELRNYAISMASEADIIITFDSDDVPHPNRIAEQVAFLQSSGADVVGYDEVLFWRVPNYARSHGKLVEGGPGEAWLYSHNRVPNRHAPGTSFCYWRKYWERNPFKDLPKNNESTGEDYEFVQGAKLATCSSVSGPLSDELRKAERLGDTFIYQPRLIASIHGGNTMHYDQIEKKSQNWRRVPEFDSYCRERMAL